MDLNETIFEAVKSKLCGEQTNENEVEENSEDNELLLKVCLGTATEEEKKTWVEEKGISDEVLCKLKEYCDMGYNMAAQLDGHNEKEKEKEEQEKRKEEEEKGNLLKKIEELSKEVECLKLRVDFLERGQTYDRKPVPELCANNL